MFRKYQQLVVWQKSIELVGEIYRLTKAFPNDEKFGLTSQLRRAAVSIPSNIAEGAGRGSDNDFCRFLYQARGSLTEVETQLLISQQLQYCSIDIELDELTQQIFAMLNRLIQRLSTNVVQR